MTVEQIREYVDAYIRKNGKRAITGAILNLALQEIVNYAELIESSISGGTQADWNATSGLAEILNKPSVFPPASHTHAQSEITGLVAALAAKADSSHTHAQSDITGLVAALAGKANSSHTHAQSDITGLVAALSSITSDISALETLVGSDNINLDSVQEIVDAIETIQTSLSTILVNDLTTGGTTKALTAQQGVVLKGLIDTINSTLTDFFTVDYIADLASKQDTLVSGGNIKSIELQSLLGSGNLDFFNNKTVYFFTDFLNIAATLNSIWSGTAISTGTFAQNTTSFTDNNFGVGRITKSATANSGYRFLTDVTAIRIKGKEKFRTRVSFAEFTTLTFRAGFIDTTTNADCVDGCYFELSGSGNLIGKNASNSVRTSTPTIATLSLNTWYTLEITVNIFGTDVSYVVYNATGTLIGSGSVASNIPTGVGRETGCGFVCTGSGATVITLANVDHMELKMLLTR
jgi:hypothetical protein